MGTHTEYHEMHFMANGHSLARHRSASTTRRPSCSTVASSIERSPTVRFNRAFTCAWVRALKRTSSRARSAFFARSDSFCSKRDSPPLSPRNAIHVDVDIDDAVDRGGASAPMSMSRPGCSRPEGSEPVAGSFPM